MKVVSYLKSVPGGNNNPQKEALLIKFVQGVSRTGDQSMLHKGFDLLDCDVSVIQGWIHNKIDTPHLRLRKEIIDHQSRTNKHVCVADASLFYYANANNPHGYLRYSYDGVFPDSGIYFDDVIDKNRWQQISKDVGISLETKRLGSNLLICAQRDNGWSMGSYSVKNWLIDTINLIRKYSDRKIVIRSHPGDRANKNYLNDISKMRNVSISIPGTPLDKDLTNTWAVINHNSSSVVGPVLQGYPAFITDPIKSQCAEVAHTDFSKLESPEQFDRQRWLERISMFHWKFSELEDGSAWRHMRAYVRQ